jgi:predicted aconitase with swiveling domain
MYRVRCGRADHHVSVFIGHPGIGSAIRAHALVASDDFSARYDLDRLRGVFSRESHQLYGQSYVGRVLVLNTAKGGVASAWMLREMAERGMAPAALLFNRVNPILAQGAVFAQLPLIDRFAVDITKSIENGDELLIEPAIGQVTIVS